MSVTNENAVLILGAGASAQFNLPVGGSLLDDIRDKVQKELTKTNSEIQAYSIYDTLDKFYGSNQSDELYLSRYTERPIFATYLYQSSPNKRATYECVIKLVDEAERAVRFLKIQTADTIDAFIAENPSVSTIVKIAIANIFFERLYTINSNNFGSKWVLNSLNDRLLKQERNWVHLLINLVRHGYTNGWVTEQNPLKVITFNYDTTLEKILTKAFSNTERELPPWGNLIKIKHMHGRMPLLEDKVEDPFVTTSAMAEAIEVATEAKPRSEVSKERGIAKSWVTSANDIYACGFAFAGPNCRLLGLNKKQTKPIKKCGFVILTAIRELVILQADMVYLTKA